MKIKNAVILAILFAMLICGCETMKNQRRQDYVTTHPELTQQTKQDILEGRIRIGMTREQVKATWGYPDDINRTVGSWGEHEQWIYGYDIRFRRYLYFENGKLTSWSD